MENLQIAEQKIVSLDELRHRIAVWRFRDQKIVFTNGCFDILHLGHVEYLAKAKNLGDILIIGLNTDESVRKLKGNHRPVNPERARAIILASLWFTDAIVLFGEDTPESLIREVRPDILVKGKDYEEKEIVGADFVKSTGGSVITIELTEGFSTTDTIRRMKE